MPRESIPVGSPICFRQRVCQIEALESGRNICQSFACPLRDGLDRRGGIVTDFHGQHSKRCIRPRHGTRQPCRSGAIVHAVGPGTTLQTLPDCGAYDFGQTVDVRRRSGPRRPIEHKDPAANDAAQMLAHRREDVLGRRGCRKPSRKSVQGSHLLFTLLDRANVRAYPFCEMAGDDGNTDEETEVDDLLRVGHPQVVDRRIEEER